MWELVISACRRLVIDLQKLSILVSCPLLRVTLFLYDVEGVGGEGWELVLPVDTCLLQVSLQLVFACSATDVFELYLCKLMAKILACLRLQKQSD